MWWDRVFGTGRGDGEGADPSGPESRESGRSEGGTGAGSETGIVVEPAPDESASRRAAPDGGQSSPDGGSATEWAGEDPISFDDEPEAGALLDAVNVDPEPAGERGDAPETGEASPDGDETTESAVDAVSDVAPAPAEGPGDDEQPSSGPAPDATDEPAADPDPGEEHAGVDADELRDRLDAVEAAHDRVAETVAVLEAELDGLDGRIDGVHEDVERLVGLVREAAPTRGGTAAGTTAGTAAGDSGPQSADGRSIDVSPTAPLSTGADGVPDEDAGEGDEASGRDAGRGGADEQGVDGDDGRDANDGERPTGGAGGPTAGSSSPGPGEDGTADPRSDAVADRLREYQSCFDGVGAERAIATEQAAGDGADGAAGDGAPEFGDFEFRKVLVPTDGEGEPVVVGGDLEPPYLETVPDGYAEERAIIEWLDGLVSAADGETAADALAFYESVGWLAPDVRETLTRYLDGYDGTEHDDGRDGAGRDDDGRDGTGRDDAGRDEEDSDGTSSSAGNGGEGRPEPGEDHAASAGEHRPGPPEALDGADHRRSFEYVTRLAAGEVEPDGI